MDSRPPANLLTPDRIKRMKTLVKLFAKSKLSQYASVRVIHDYTRYQCGRDYVLHGLENGSQGYLQGYGGNVHSGDRIILRKGGETVQYQVDAIEYYPESTNLWIARVRLESGTANNQPVLHPV
jgi:hypothetical protein